MKAKTKRVIRGLVVAILFFMLGIYIAGMLYIDYSGNLNQDFKNDSIFQYYQ